ncbi:nuclear pore complex protein Nup50 [Syngnathoides biaculeatus]|uniref:nuclear pore complex protein Nup50 n=1 Tax=Syngnathoides biaculeatus TaxID=300417 RepID=UPI002ADD58E3|nr:nuclear pore complex protein Nup50 [Syngnathoides biaculeatus]XP_061662345.1 nuclear pore complex protein Nup50 [Syngnathoides biaculeatus]XP_061662346.1 nuclear pore complex protein Nup50 [Syngnathoides biaculeatus]
MAKRNADKELTDRNWDQEEEGEEAGTFSVATEDVMKKRAIKKAKRRNVGPEGEPGGAFRGFKGFSASAPSAPTPFSAFGNGAGFKGLSSLTNGSGGAFLALSFADASSSASPAASAAGAAFNGSAGKEYGRQLTALNCSVRDWISKHVDDNPLCDLQPIFRDYERHLASIERQYGAAASGAQDRKARPSLPASPSSFSFKGENEESPAATFDPGQKTATPAFSLFGGASRPPAETDRAGPSEANEDDAYEPPEPDVKEVKEDDAFYSKRCKLFYKKDGEFKEKGVGTLHLKETAGGKTQMIVRADTNLGNILLNVLLPAGVPCSRVGKNNVMVVCVPNPPVDDKNPGTPVPLLIRVKTADDADQLHRTLEEKRG